MEPHEGPDGLQGRGRDRVRAPAGGPAARASMSRRRVSLRARRAEGEAPLARRARRSARRAARVARASPRGVVLPPGIPRRSRGPRARRPRARGISPARGAAPGRRPPAPPRLRHREYDARLPVRLSDGALARHALSARLRGRLGRLRGHGAAGRDPVAPRDRGGGGRVQRGRDGLARMARRRQGWPADDRPPAPPRGVRADGAPRGDARLALREPGASGRVAPAGRRRLAHPRAGPARARVLPRGRARAAGGGPPPRPRAAAAAPGAGGPRPRPGGGRGGPRGAGPPPPRGPPPLPSPPPPTPAWGWWARGGGPAPAG